MKRLVIGILAHVDSGKTTLSEGLLYNAGEIKRLGRVDHKDAFLDTDTIERERGITIFSKQAQICLADCEFTLIDTPGHVDFCAEAERTLAVLDYAILVISASDGVQSHTRTLWKMISAHNIPTFIFVNKTDLENSGKEQLMSEIRKYLSDSAVDFTCERDDILEEIAMCDEEILESFASGGNVSDEMIAQGIGMRKIIPCYFGSALKNEGVAEFLHGINRYTQNISYSDEFGARVYKISADDKGKRLTHMKITGAGLKVRDIINIGNNSEKVTEIRIYSGERYESVGEVYPGSVCAVTGLNSTYPGGGLGKETDSDDLKSEPVFSYSVKLPDGYDAHSALSVFKRLEEEETKLHVDWIESKQKINIRIMGRVQLEVIKRILSERFGLCVEFENGSIIYKETIANTVEGVGHYEPLKHYAEVHLLMEPTERGSGLEFCVDCPDDVLDKNWKRLIYTHLKEKKHTGVLTGSHITDMRITVINGKAHLKHTEGGDFREATYRAIRQGLMQAKNILLEPWYSFVLEIPMESTGRAMTDLQLMGAEFNPPESDGKTCVIDGRGPVEALRDYHNEVIAYTRGTGRFNLQFYGYEECVNTDKVCESIGYDCESDIENTADSVFCSHGSGFNVKWNKVFDYMHIPLRKNAIKYEETQVKREPSKIVADDKELLRIFEMTYGKVKQKTHVALKTRKEDKPYKPKPVKILPKYLLIDGYNIIHSWEILKRLSEQNLDDARAVLISKMCNYKVMRDTEVIVVFDAYKVKGADREVEKTDGISIVYTKEAETADSYIEKTSHELSKNYNVSVATSDGLEQMIIFGSGAQRITPAELLKEVENAEEEIREFIRENNIKNSGYAE